MLGVGLAQVAHDMWDYNRQIFKYDQNQRLKRDMAALEMRIKQFDLYREDVRDLVELTVSRMDIYHMVGAMLLQFIVVLFAEGRVEFEVEGQLAPHWFMEIYYLSLGSAFIFLLVSVWLAMHASVAAQSFGTRMLTRFVRLPIPNAEVLNRARTKLGQFERGGIKNIFRIPFLSKAQTWRGDAAVSDEPREEMKTIPAIPEDPREKLPFQVGEFPKTTDELVDGHIQLYRKLQGRWQSFDAYSRVAMALGFNQVIQSICTFIIMHMCLEQGAPWSAFMACLPLQFVSLVLLNLDIKHAQAWEFYTALAGSFGAPFANLAAIIFYHEATDYPWLTDITVVFCLICHAAWLIVARRFARPEVIDGVSLPFRFRTVLYLDVFADTLSVKKAKAQSYEARKNALNNLQKAMDDALMGAHQPFPTMSALKACAEACMELVSSPEDDEEMQQMIMKAACCFEEQKIRGEELNVRRAFRRWNSEGVQTHLSEYSKLHIRSLERQFEQTLDELVRESAQPAVGTHRGGASLLSTGSCALLEIEYETGYEHTQFYYNRHTDEVVWEVDEGVHDRKRESLETLTEKVQRYRVAVDEFLQLQHVLHDDDMTIVSQSTIADPSTWEVRPQRPLADAGVGATDAAGNPVLAQAAGSESGRTKQKLKHATSSVSSRAGADPREVTPIIAEHDDNIHFTTSRIDRDLKRATSFVPGAQDASRRKSQRRRNKGMRSNVSFIGAKAFSETVDAEAVSPPERLPWGVVSGALNAFCIMWVLAAILGTLDIIVPHAWWPWHGSHGSDPGANLPEPEVSVHFSYPTPFFEARALHCFDSVVCENKFGMSWERSQSSWNVVNTTLLDNSELHLGDRTYNLSGTPHSPFASSSRIAAAFDGEGRVVVYRLEPTRVLYGVKVEDVPRSVDVGEDELLILHSNSTIVRYEVSAGHFLGAVKVRNDTLAACRIDQGLLLATSKEIRRATIK